MQRQVALAPKAGPPKTLLASGWVTQPLLIGFLALLVVVGASVGLPQGLPAGWNWTQPALLSVAAALTCTAAARQLPAQNIALAGLIIGLSILLVAVACTATGLVYPPSARWRGLGATWCAALVWLVALLNSRATAQLILPPWRNTPNYGLWLLGLASLLAMEFVMALQPVISQSFGSGWAAAGTGSDWLWQPQTLFAFIAWTVLAALLLLVLSPVLISKAPRPMAPSFAALAIWSAPNLLCATACASRQRWGLVCALAAVWLAVVTLAVVGVSWRAGSADEETSRAAT